MGAAVTPEGGNVCVYSKFATRVELRLFDREDAAVPALVVELNPVRQRTSHDWQGPWQPERGLRFDGRNLVLDPYGLAVVAPSG